MDNCTLMNQISISTIKQKTTSAEGCSDSLGITYESDFDDNINSNELNIAQISDEQSDN
jgi:hypothetical protein